MGKRFMNSILNKAVKVMLVLLVSISTMLVVNTTAIMANTEEINNPEEQIVTIDKQENAGEQNDKQDLVGTIEQNDTEEQNNEDNSVVADGQYEAKIGAEYYSTFSFALANVKSGETIELLKNITIDQELVFDLNGRHGTYTINGAGKTINVKSDLETPLKNVLSISNSYISDKFYFHNITFDGAGKATNGLYLFNGDYYLGGEITKNNTIKRDDIDKPVVIKGTTTNSIYGGYNGRTFIEQNANVNIFNAKISKGIEYVLTLNIVDGEFGTDYNDGTYEATILDNNLYTTIGGGTFNGVVNIDRTSYFLNKYSGILGGTFNGKIEFSYSTPRDTVVIGKFAKGKNTENDLRTHLYDYSVIDISDVNYFIVDLKQAVAMIENTEYGTLQDALNAVKRNQTIELLRDVRIDAELHLDLSGYSSGDRHGTFIIEGNGHTISVDSNLQTTLNSIISINGAHQSSVDKFYFHNLTLNGNNKATNAIAALQGGIYLGGDYTGDSANPINVYADANPVIIENTIYSVTGTTASSEPDLVVVNGDLGGKIRTFSLRVFDGTFGGEIDTNWVMIHNGTFNSDIHVVRPDCLNPNSDYDGICGGTFEGSVNVSASTTLKVFKSGKFKKLKNPKDNLNKYIYSGSEIDEVDDYYVIDTIRPVARIGETEYYSLQEALDAVKRNQIIKILKNIQIDRELQLNLSGYSSGDRHGTFTIEGNGHTISVDPSINQPLNNILSINSAHDPSADKFYFHDLTFDGNSKAINGLYLSGGDCYFGGKIVDNAIIDEDINPVIIKETTINSIEGGYINQNKTLLSQDATINIINANVSGSIMYAGILNIVDGTFGGDLDYNLYTTILDGTFNGEVKIDHTLNFLNQYSGILGGIFNGKVTLSEQVSHDKTIVSGAFNTSNDINTEEYIRAHASGSEVTTNGNYIVVFPGDYEAKVQIKALCDNEEITGALSYTSGPYYDGQSIIINAANVKHEYIFDHWEVVDSNGKTVSEGIVINENTIKVTLSTTNEKIVKAKYTKVVATIGENDYTTLQAAINSINENTKIDLVADTDEAIIFEKAYNVIIDNHSHTVGANTFTVNSGNLTITNSEFLGYDNWNVKDFTTGTEPITEPLTESAAESEAEPTTGSVLFDIKGGSLTLDGNLFLGVVSNVAHTINIDSGNLLIQDGFYGGLIKVTGEGKANAIISNGFITEAERDLTNDLIAHKHIDSEVVPTEITKVINNNNVNFKYQVMKDAVCKIIITEAKGESKEVSVPYKELQEALDNVEKGQTIELLADIQIDQELKLVLSGDADGNRHGTFTIDGGVDEEGHSHTITAISAMDNILSINNSFVDDEFYFRNLIFDGNGVAANGLYLSNGYYYLGGKIENNAAVGDTNPIVIKKTTENSIYGGYKATTYISHDANINIFNAELNNGIKYALTVNIVNGTFGGVLDYNLYTTILNGTFKSDVTIDRTSHFLNKEGIYGGIFKGEVKFSYSSPSKFIYGGSFNQDKNKIDRLLSRLANGYTYILSSNYYKVVISGGEGSVVLLTVSATSPAMAQGQGNYLPEQQVTVKAINNILGYKFVGWYECVDNAATGSIRCEEETYTFDMPHNNLNLIAVYQSEALFTLQVSAPEFKVNGELKEGHYIGKYPTGKDIRIEYTDDSKNLAYWTDGIKKTSMNNVYEFKLINNTSLEAITEGRLHKYIFVSAYNQVLLMDSYDTDNSTPKTIYAPQAPFKAGGNFVGWRIEGQSEVYNGNNIGGIVEEYIKSGSAPKIIYIEPVYETVTGDCSLTVEYYGIERNNDTYPYNEEGIKEIEAPNTGEQFLYWKIDDKIVSFSNKCCFYLRVGEDKKVTAVYGPSAISRLPVSYLGSLFTNDEQTAMTFVYIGTVPTGYTPISRGVLFTYDASLANENDLKYGTENVSIKTREDKGSGANTYYSWTLKNIKESQKDLVVYTRGFVNVLDGNGVSHTYYSDIKSASINQLLEINDSTTEMEEN